MLKTGPETDRRVVDALGFNPDEHGEFVVDGVHWRLSDYHVLDSIYGDETQGMFNPSSDLNDAFWAAERADLYFAVGRDTSGKYFVLNSIQLGEFAHHESAALAICAAILKLKGQA
jgi:hypothetical protein